MPMIGARFYTQVENCLLHNDLLENELTKEMENGRLFRLLTKLGVINERPQYVHCCQQVFGAQMVCECVGLAWIQHGLRQEIDIC
jgi:hypothetical protein